MSKDKLDYKKLRAELDEILISLDDDSLDVVVMTDQYKRGMEIIKQLEQQLKTAQNEINKIKSSFEA